MNSHDERQSDERPDWDAAAAFLNTAIGYESNEGLVAALAELWASATRESGAGRG